MQNDNYIIYSPDLIDYIENCPKCRKSNFYSLNIAYETDHIFKCGHKRHIDKGKQQAVEVLERLQDILGCNPYRE